MITRRDVVAVLLGIVLLASTGWAQDARPPLQKPPEQVVLQSKKRGLAPIKRLELALQKEQEPDVLMPVVMHTIERGLQGSQRSGSSELDRIFDQVLQRHPEVNRQILQRLVADYKALPPSVRARGLPAPLANLDPARPIEPAVLQSVGRTVLAPRAATLLRIAPVVSKQQTLNYFGKVELAAVVKALVPLVQKLISWLGGDPDHLGTRYIGWSALELLQATDNAQKRFTGTLVFRNSGDTGSYMVTYEVIRVE